MKEKRFLTHTEALAQFSLAVRESSVKRFRKIPPGKVCLRVREGGMNVAELAYHILEADKWLFEKLRNRDLQPMVGRVGFIHDLPAETFHTLVEDLDSSGRKRSELIRSLSDNQLFETITDARFRGETTIWWVIVRGNLDHEIHHRGQLSLYLRLLEVSEDTNVDSPVRKHQSNDSSGSSHNPW